MPEPLILTVAVFSDLGNLGHAIRREVFVGEQHVPPEEEFDGHDLTATHVVAVLEGDVIGALRRMSPHPNGNPRSRGDHVGANGQEASIIA